MELREKKMCLILLDKPISNELWVAIRTHFYPKGHFPSKLCLFVLHFVLISDDGRSNSHIGPEPDFRPNFHFYLRKYLRTLGLPLLFAQIFAKTFAHARICANICDNISGNSVGNRIRTWFPTDFTLLFAQIFTQIQASFDQDQSKSKQGGPVAHGELVDQQQHPGADSDCQRRTVCRNSAISEGRQNVLERHRKYRSPRQVAQGVSNLDGHPVGSLRWWGVPCTTIQVFIFFLK